MLITRQVSVKVNCLGSNVEGEGPSEEWGGKSEGEGSSVEGEG